MSKPLGRIEQAFRLTMVLVGLAVVVYLVQRLVDGKTIEADVQTVPVARTGPVMTGPDGHGYQYVAAPNITWTAARAAAGLRHWQGKQGYLATVDNSAELAFITATLFPKAYPNATYVGGRQTTPGQWRWVTGPDGRIDDGKGRLFWNGYEKGSAPPGTFADWMGTAFNQGGRWDSHKVCCVTLFSYHRPQFSTALGTGSHAEGISGYLVEFGG